MTAPICVDIISEAESWLKTPYQHQASLKGVGCDCLGLVRGVFRALYGFEPERPPAYTPNWAEASAQETLADAALRHLKPVDITALKPGHIMLFRWRAGLPAKHAGILVSPTRFIHAHDGAAVSHASLTPWWQ
ncbi:MAG: C40 family peptidase, partial [Rhizobiales bacterium]|nr:C40 family peptidase [Hyphomicrobiales bacterium]